MDLNLDSGVSIGDWPQFLSSFGGSVVFPAPPAPGYSAAIQADGAPFEDKPAAVAAFASAFASFNTLSTGVVVDFVSDAGTVTFEPDGTKVVAVDPGTVIGFTTHITTVPDTVTGFQFDFANSDVALDLNGWTTGSAWPAITDGLLETPADTFVSAGTFTPQTAPPNLELGTFQAVAPTTPGDYLMTVDSGGTGPFDTKFVSTLGDLPIEDFGDILIRVVGNRPPVLDAIGNKSVDEQAELTFAATASDPDLPADTLTFSLDTAAEALGMSITSAGAFSWTPSELQGGASYNATVTVSDGGLSDSETISITVAEVGPTIADLGPIDFLLLEHLSLLDGSLFYRVETSHEGFLTLQVDVPKPVKSARLKLYDADPVETVGLTPLARPSTKTATSGSIGR